MLYESRMSRIVVDAEVFVQESGEQMVRLTAQHPVRVVAGGVTFNSDDHPQLMTHFLTLGSFEERYQPCNRIGSESGRL